MENFTLTLRTTKLAPASLADGVGDRERQRDSGRIFRLLAVVGLLLVPPSLWAQKSQSDVRSPKAAWSTIQQLVQNLQSAVQSKNLHGIHEPSMKIRVPIRALKQQSGTLSADTGQKMIASLKQLDDAITDLHSASDAGNQKDAESALKEVETAFDQLKSLDPDTAFKDVHG